MKTDRIRVDMSEDGVRLVDLLSDFRVKLYHTHRRWCVGINIRGWDDADIAALASRDDVYPVSLYSHGADILSLGDATRGFDRGPLGYMQGEIQCIEAVIHAFNNPERWDIWLADERGTWEYYCGGYDDYRHACDEAHRALEEMLLCEGGVTHEKRTS